MCALLPCVCMCVCVCVCVFCMCACMCVCLCVFVFTSAHVNASICPCLNACTYINTSACVEQAARTCQLLLMSVSSSDKTLQSVIVYVQVQPQSSKKSDWRRKHEEFIAAIRNAKGVQKAMEKGEPLPPPPPPTINPGNPIMNLYNHTVKHSWTRSRLF